MRAATTVFFFMVVVAAASRTPTITNVYRGGTHLEAPHWSVTENALYWVDISKQMVYRMDGQSGNITTREIGYGPVTFAVTVKDNPKLIVISSRAEVYLLPWDSDSQGDSAMRLLGAVDIGRPDNRCNDGKVDAKGRLWFGTQGSEQPKLDKNQGSLFMMDQYNHAYPETKLRPVSLSNGMAWTADSKLMFYIDSETKNIDVLDFNLNAGNIRNRRVLFNLPANNITGIPDGMTIDRDDNLWVACYGAGMVIKVNSRSGKLLQRYKMPVSSVTSVVWGGRDFSTLYVTSSRRDLTPRQLLKEPEAGSLFAIEGTGARGFPENQFVFPNASCY